MKSATQIDLSCSVEFPSASMEGKKEVLAMASLRAPTMEIEESSKRAAINIVCVIDRSGSMAGSKLNLTKDALNFVIDQMDQGDSLGLVTYDTGVSTNLDLLQMTKENKGAAKNAVKAISAGSMTNLSGGLLAGLSMASSKPCTILLFTDGLANVGVTGVNQITTMTESKLASCKEGSQVFTFGFGADHDANMLRSIATAGKGMYYFVETVDQIPLSFADCIGGLQSVVAQNLKLTVEGISNSVIVKVLSNAYKTTGPLPGTSLTVALGDLYSEEERDLLFSFELPALTEPNNAFEFCQFKLEYFNVINVSDETHTATGIVARTAQKIENQSRNLDLDKQMNRLAAAQAMEKGRMLADSGKFEEAKAVLHSTKVQFETSATSNETYTRALFADMDEALDNLESETSYKSAGRQKMFSKAQSHGVQRSSEATLEGALYENKSKAAKKKAFFG